MQPTNNEPKELPEQKPSRDFKSFFSPSTARDIVAYVLLALGIVLLFFQPLYGGLLIGIVVGVYFAKDILFVVRHFEEFIDERGTARSIILLGLLLAFFISAPAIFIGAVLVMAIQLFITD